jgi:hypothetical protein
MAEPTNQLKIDILKSPQADMAGVRQTLADHGQQFIALRDQMHGMHRSLQTHIHDLQGDMIPLKKGKSG